MKPSDHVTAAVLERYAAGGAGIGADALWAVEAHLEWCAPCRERLGEAVARRSPETVSLLALVQANLATEVARSPRMPARRLPRRVARWAPPGLWPRLAMTMLVLAAALGLDLVGQQPAAAVAGAAGGAGGAAARGGRGLVGRPRPGARAGGGQPAGGAVPWCCGAPWRCWSWSSRR